jgi:DNA polymerase bacteriophage-type
MDKNIFLDFESFGVLDLKRDGLVNYACHPSTKILMMGFLLPNSKEVIQWVPGENENHQVLFEFLKDNPDISIHAWNSQFEQNIWNLVGVPKYGFPEFSNWKCSMSLAASFGSPMSLEKAGEYFKADIRKMAEGKKAMLKFCKPQKKAGTPEEWQTLLEYNKLDVLTEKSIHEKFPDKDLSPTEFSLWNLTGKINSRGIVVDMDLAWAVSQAVEFYFEETKKLVFELTNGEISSANQRVKILEFLKTNGVFIDNLQAKTVSDYLENKEDLPPIAVKILTARQDLANNSLKRFDTILNLKNGDRVFNGLQYFGSHTGRYSGKGFQPQNFPRTNMSEAAIETAISLAKSNCPEKLPEIFEKTFGKSFPVIAKNLLRPTLMAAEGRTLLAADFKGIENRVAAWISNDQTTLDNFSKGVDQYIDMAKTIYKKEDITDSMRQIGKRVVLGCQFGLGPDGLIINLKNANIEIDFYTAQKYVNAYRKKYFKMVNFWDELAAKTLSAYCDRRRYLVEKIAVYRRQDYLCFLLPSGRIFYFGNMKIGLDKNGYKCLYSGFTQLYRGIIFQNMVQAIARDIMASAMLRLDSAGFSIITSVHDEIICEGTPDKFDSFKEVMNGKESWFSDLPVECEFYMNKRFL